ncbi:hypothetical protein Tco_1478861, partial [Tanacetum coccineum]
MTKIIKGEFEKIKDVKVEDVSLTCDTPLEVFNNEVSRLSGMDDDLFTYEVEVANIPCNSNMDDDSEHEADNDMGYDPSDVAFIEWRALIPSPRLRFERVITELFPIVRNYFSSKVVYGHDKEFQSSRRNREGTSDVDTSLVEWP